MTAPATRSALAAVLGAAAEAAKLPPAEQLALLPPSQFGPDTKRHRVMREHVARHDRGRPPGAQNLATRDVLAFVRQVLGDPVLERARWMRHTPATLAAELGCTPLEAFDRLDRIRADLALLFYPRLAPVDGDGNAVVPQFTMQIGGGNGAPGVDRPPWAYLEQTQQNQGFSSDEDPVSHADVSHAEPK